MKRMSLPPTPVAWPHVYAVWHAAFTAHGDGLPEPLLYEAPIHIDDVQVARTLARTEAYTWWPRDAVRRDHVRLQYTALSVPAWVYMYEGTKWGVSAGEAMTAAFLAAGDTVEQVAGVLIAASLHARARSLPRAGGPSYRILDDLERVARAAADLIPGEHWHHKARTTLPYLDDDNTTPCPTMDAFVRMLGREHAEVFRRFRPVQLVFGAGDDQLLAAVRAAMVADAAAAADADTRARQARAEEDADRAAYVAAHPRGREWPLDRAALETLVWSMPTTAIANEFGVSDVAVGKRCKRLGIAKPPPGFWRNVETGAVPHPQGKPPRAARRSP